MTAKPRSRSHILSESDIKAICDNAKAPIDQVILICCLFCGMRVGETAHLKRSWWNGSEITIPAKQPCSCYECNLESRKDKKGIWTPKTDRAERVIPVSKAYGLYMDKFFVTHKGIGLSRIRIYQRLKTIASKAGLKSNVFPHALRATFLTDLIEKGVELWIVKEVAGHATIRTTEGYVRLRPQAVKREFEKKVWK